MRWKTSGVALFVMLISSGADLEGQGKHESADAIEVPFKLYNDHLIVVKGTLGTLKDVNILLDTGKSPTAVSTKVASKLQLRGHRESMLLSNGAIDVESVVLPRFEFGALEPEALRTVVQDLGYLERNLGIPIDGIAGLDVLRKRSFAIDYKRKKIVFGLPNAGTKTVPFETLSPFATVKAVVAGQEMRLLVDSGTRGLLLYRSRVKVKLEEVSNRDPEITTARGAMRTRFARAANVRLGGENLGPQNVVIAEVEVSPKYEFDGLMGFKQLGFGKVWLDFEHGLFGWE
jgi:predicted aspartyl protease